ncbi:MBL fold metallo-hydrolase [Burkholderia gladioli]|uniref:Beta-lactamase superfamily domain protein n=1 Tax=Burkholderia gladioli TaxID=28095 RepID=A0AAW3F361_BURGA|nr:MBL fold metallo-hydrolase [Burkholderia gladioli]AJW96527.1 beta-lactamase superfamily domain protein [Burkholderia gladioli]ASD83927.1 MBL fold metallo-hydrolase [Burkholderia gladioli pv. gladioli]AWY51351.1 MBL fold metallo-hydrolase [Burkholderia gladioli pv. gladioli]KGC15679.1 beta-lactamase superfamily domain protein [Burkholderia gladioli]MBU9273590.1 MBL fold metallo-hydrolase [Burkholderia gladioli]
MTTTNITLIGGPTVVIEIGGFRLLTDPTFDPPGIYNPYKDKPIEFHKTTGPALSPEQIGRVDAILLSHDHHFDNLDNAGRAMLPSVEVAYTTQSGEQRLQGNAVGLAPHETTKLHGPDGQSLYITGTPARHGPVGIEPLSGDVIGFLIGENEPGDAIYVTGDTVWYEGTADIAKRYSPKLVILFTGAAEPRGRFQMTMDSNDALAAAHAFPNASILAVHNEGWRHNTENADELAAVFQALGVGTRLTALERGKPTRFEW